MKQIHIHSEVSILRSIVKNEGRDRNKSKQKRSYAKCLGKWYTCICMYTRAYCIVSRVLFLSTTWMVFALMHVHIYRYVWILIKISMPCYDLDYLIYILPFSGYHINGFELVIFGVPVQCGWHTQINIHRLDFVPMMSKILLGLLLVFG